MIAHTRAKTWIRRRPSTLWVEVASRAREVKVARNASWMFVGHLVNFALNAAFFVLLARFLGAREYGVFAGAFAFVSTATPYSALGYRMLYMRYVSTDKSSAGIYWGNAVLVVSVISVVLACSFAILGPVVTGAPSMLLFVMLVFANGLCQQVTYLGSTVFLTADKAHVAAGLNVVSNLARLITLILMGLVVHHATAVQWSMGIAIASFLAALISNYLVRSALGKPGYSAKLLLLRLREGIGFSFAGTTDAVYNDVDKTILSHYGLNRESGFYTLAYRVVDFASAPVNAIEAALCPRLFRLNQEGLLPVIRVTIRTLAGSILLSGLASFCTFVIAPVVPHLVGRDFSEVIVALRWLCWLPILRSVHRISGSALTCSGHQDLRTAAQFLVAAINVLLNLCWIRRFGWLGAAWSSLFCDGALGVLNGTIVVILFYRRRQWFDPGDGLASITDCKHPV